MFINKLHIILITCLLFLSTACKKDDANPYSVLTHIPEGFPNMKIPTDNEFTIERWALGKKLFYEKSLSIDSSVSCASCHKLEFAFSDNVSKTSGVFNLSGSRNAPTLTNVGFQPYYTKEGGIPTLEQHILIPIEEHNEMGFNILDAGIRLNKVDDYKKLSLNAYQKEMDYYVITRAIACFERTLISSNSKYDKWLKNEVSLDESEQRGKELFFDERTNCSSCHSGVFFTNYGFFNNGLYETYNDVGKYRLTLDNSDLGVFKVPTLRNINFTAPYMHDGSLNTLKEVVQHYNSGGSAHINKSNLIKPLGLSETEINDLVKFLETLSDYEFTNNKLFSNE